MCVQHTIDVQGFGFPIRLSFRLIELFSADNKQNEQRIKSFMTLEELRPRMHL